MSERAAIVVPLPLSVVESNVWDVTSWATFLAGVEWIERNAHERYVFGVRQGRRVHDVPVNVRWYARDHRVLWRELSGPAWRGEIRLTALNGRRTRIALELTAQPRSFATGLADLFGRRRHDVTADLTRLADLMTRIPQPFNPARLETPRHVAGKPSVRAAHAEEYLGGHVDPVDEEAVDGVQILEAGAI